VITESFVNAIRDQAPVAKQFENLGLPKEYVQERLLMYILEKRFLNITFGDSLLDLVANYDLTNLRIGMVRFNDEVREDDNYYHIGNVEVDFLMKNKMSGIIEVLEFDQPSHVLWKCASNGDAFLDALLLCDSYLTNCIFDDALFDNDEVRLAMISECAEKAGGIEYINFYHVLLG
jgi:hypothetical protein